MAALVAPRVMAVPGLVPGISAAIHAFAGFSAEVHDAAWENLPYNNHQDLIPERVATICSTARRRWAGR